MLNISENTVHCDKELANLKAPNQLSLSRRHMSMRNLLVGMLLLFLVFLFLPWTQNIQADGKVTTLRPEHRPQTIHSTISGRIEKWYVTEGQFVRKGDTIVYLSEVKSEYFDPRIVERVGNQVDAKLGSIEAYGGKVGALDDQIAAMQLELDSKLKQTRNKVEQAGLKVVSDSMKIVEAQLELRNYQNQYERTRELFNKNIKSLTEMQDKQIKFQEAQTKLLAAQNQYEISQNDLRIYRQELALTQNEYANKIAKARSDQFSTISDQYDARATVNKLQIERENYARRMSFYYIVAPQDCYVVKAVMPGIGEIIKEGAPVVSIIPKEYQLAVELYVRPLDLPLISVGRQVRFIFDGWPAFFFSGWPGVSTGTFGGRVVAIDRNISSNGRFRILVASDPDMQPWPDRLQVGGGAHGIALLNNVPMWYELWRVLNGFPPDLYAYGDAKEEKDDGIIPKAPIKSAK